MSSFLTDMVFLPSISDPLGAPNSLNLSRDRPPWPGLRSARCSREKAREPERGIEVGVLDVGDHEEVTFFEQVPVGSARQMDGLA